MNKPIRVLVVDDDAKMRELLLDTLSALGYEALGARDGEEALSLLEDEKIDLVVTDIKMPKISGVALLQEIKEKNPELPVVLITGYNSIYPMEEMINQGANGFISKPFRIGRIEELIVKVLNAKPEKGGAKGRPTKKILVVDDDEALRSVLEETLVSFNYEVTTASDGQEALKKLKEGSYDLVVTDIKMPRMNGNELLKKIKEASPGIPVVIITAYPAAYSQQWVMEEGADGYLTKPFHIDRIDKLIRELTLEKIPSPE
jgi:DNA-binding NtrC family response regulator